MAKAVEKSVTDTPFLDDTDDFIQSHVDSHLPPSKEVIEEEREEKAEQANLDDGEIDKGWFDTDAWSDITVKLRDPGGPPPRLIDGTGGSAACPEVPGYANFQECLDANYGDTEYCEDICFDDDGDGGGGDYNWGCVARELVFWCIDYPMWCYGCYNLIALCIADPSQISCIGAIACVGGPIGYALAICR